MTLARADTMLEPEQGGALKDSEESELGRMVS